MTKKAVFLDRDGVIIRVHVRQGRPYSVTDLSELEILPGVPDALNRLHLAGFRLIVVTNQPDVARGIQTRATVESINNTLKEKLPLDEVRVCYHDDADHCHCRKPEAGLLLDAAREAQLDLSSCYMIGDRWRDVEAGRRAGCATIFVDYGYAEKQPVDFDIKVKSLAEASEWICSAASQRQKKEEL